MTAARGYDTHRYMSPPRELPTRRRERRGLTEIRQVIRPRRTAMLQVEQVSCEVLGIGRAMRSMSAEPLIGRRPSHRQGHIGWVVMGKPCPYARPDDLPAASDRAGG